MNLRVPIFMFVAIVLGALPGCDSYVTETLNGAAPNVAPSVSGGIRLQAGDKLKITIYGEDKLSGEYEVAPAGAVSLPLAGTVQAAGLTKPELEQLLSKKFAADRFLRSPKVTVDIASFKPFYILGEVEKPGEYPYKSGLNVMSAIAMAGGNTYRSSQSRITIQRSGEQSFRDYPMSPTIPVYPGDLVRVPERYF